MPIGIKRGSLIFVPMGIKSRFHVSTYHVRALTSKY